MRTERMTGPIAAALLLALSAAATFAQPACWGFRFSERSGVGAPLCCMAGRTPDRAADG